MHTLQVTPKCLIQSSFYIIYLQMPFKKECDNIRSSNIMHVGDKGEFLISKIAI